MYQKKIMKKEGSDVAPHFEYIENVKVKVFFEDIESVHAKMKLYESYGVLAVSFWRIGQGPHDLWDTITLERHAARQDIPLGPFSP